MINILQRYAYEFREMVNEKNRVSDESIKKLLKLNKEEDWAFFCSGMDVIDDASEAIKNFLKYGLDGPIKQTDIGEKYLRLYGILNATYIQQESIKKLVKLNSLQEIKTINDKINSIKIREVRHKLGSHSIDYKNPNTNKIETYIPIRISLSGFNCEFLNNDNLQNETLDLKDAIEKHIEVIVDITDKLFKKSITTFFKGYQERLEKCNEILEQLRAEKNGNFVIDTNNSNKILINLMTNKI